MGLRHCKVSLVAGAPSHRETLEFFMALDIPVLEMYGMSEGIAGAINLKSPGNWRTGSCGKPFKGTEMKIYCPDEHGDGEVRDVNLVNKYVGIDHFIMIHVTVML